MNAIFAVAFLAACVGAQYFDQSTDLNKYLLKSRHHYDQPSVTVTDLLRPTTTTGLWGKQFNTRSVSPWSVPTYYNNKVDTTIYTLDEIVRHPLFQQYLSLPLFRQHLTNPLFQYYLTTPLFQQYWTIPQFTTFFQNPYLFYKYVYPVVYHTESRTSSVYDNVYPVEQRQSIVDRYLNNEEDTVPQYSKNVLPVDTIFDQYKNFPVNSIYGQQYPIVNRDHLQYTTVLDKIFKSHHFVNKPVVEVVTDVKVGDIKTDEQTVGKNVDPITGEYKYNTNTEEYKVVDGKIVPVYGDRKIVLDDILARRPIDRTVVDQLYGEQYPTERFNRFNIEGKHLNVKDAILKRLYLNKVLSGDRKIDEVFPEYTTEFKNIPVLEKIEKLNKLHRFENVDKINGVDKLESFDELLRTPVDSDLLRRL